MRINRFRDGKGFLTVLPHNKNIYYVNIEERPLPSLLPFPAESIRLSEYDAILTSEHPRKPNQSPIQTALNNLRKQSSLYSSSYRCQKHPKTLDQIWHITWQADIMWSWSNLTMTWLFSASHSSDACSTSSSQASFSWNLATSAGRENGYKTPEPCSSTAFESSSATKLHCCTRITLPQRKPNATQQRTNETNMCLFTQL